MLMLYFSGTGNSKWIAQLFSEKTNALCYSIEDSADFISLIDATDTVAFCYPVYGSCVPRMMREFAALHAEALQHKKLIIFCTQMMFSGDGARAFLDSLPRGYGTVIHAEHFNMPNNICNFSLFPPTTPAKIQKNCDAATRKMQRVCENIQRGIIKKRGFSAASQLLGKTQSAFWPAIESENRSSVQIDKDCTHCGLCTKLCPMKNLTMVGAEIQQQGNCMLCYRCVNACPKKAITVLVHSKPKVQYRGLDT